MHGSHVLAVADWYAPNAAELRAEILASRPGASPGGGMRGRFVGSRVLSAPLGFGELLPRSERCESVRRKGAMASLGGAGCRAAHSAVRQVGCRAGATACRS